MNLIHNNIQGKILASKRGRLLHAPTNSPYFLHGDKLAAEYI